MNIEMWIPVLVAIISSGFSYGIARSKSKSELKSLEQSTNDKLRTMQESHKNELEKLEKEFELKASYEESQAQTELAKEFMKQPEVSQAIMKEFAKSFMKK